MNHLSEETSPYLRQHAHNPVDWYPWGDEALGKALGEDRPIFLSVGYSACHWCHVMAHDSFEDPRTAAFVNRHFVAIKVDREERPDLDALYMRSVVLMAGHGGWPLTVFLTPALKPFFGGTFFPLEAKWGIPSFRRVLEGVLKAYREDRGKVEASAAGVLEAVNESFSGPAGLSAPRGDAADAARAAILERFDPVRGGFGPGPKFPQPPLLDFLLDEAARTGDRSIADRVFLTLREMGSGGVRDQFGGGFHRYSVDGEWRVPHYEKMLYDNAQLASVYFRAFALTGDSESLSVGREILADLKTTLAAPGGGFMAAMDADSEGEEGKFYLWTPEEIASVLGPEEGPVVADLFGISGEVSLAGQTPHRVAPWHEAARKAGQGEGHFRGRVRGSLERLREARDARISPSLDSKVLTDWNALAAQAFFDGHLATGNREDLDVGLATLDRVWKRCWLDGRLFHVWDGHSAKVPGYLADYAFLARAGWRAYEVTGQGVHLERVERLLTAATGRFREGGSGRWVDAPASPRDGGLLIPVRDTEDGVLPAAISVMARLLWSWERLTGAGWAGEALDDLLAAEGGSLAKNPGARPLLAGLAAWRAIPPVEVVVAAPSMELASPLLATARKNAPPGALVLPLVAGGMSRAMAENYGLFRDRWAGSGARAYVCVGGTCRLPVTSPEEVSKQLPS